MSDDQGPVKIPDALFEATDEDAIRERREQEILTSIEARVRAGELSIREADQELMKLALEDHSFFSEHTQAALRERAEELLEESPELVESRKRIADHYGAQSGNDEGSK